MSINFRNTQIYFLVFICIISLTRSQNMKTQEMRSKDKTFKFPEAFVIESEIDPELYILGPGDKIGLNIITRDKIAYVMTITPTGDLWIPDVGAVHISGMNIKTAEITVTQYIQDNRFKSADVILVLLNIRNFRIQVIGAVMNPGLITVSSVERLTDVIRKAGGLHKLADEDNLSIKRNNKQDIKYSLRSFHLNGNLINNPIVKERDVINVPYQKAQLKVVETSISHKQSLIFVTGFVLRPIGHKFIPGLTPNDYIGMSGGVTDFGSQKNIIIYRNGNVLQWNTGDILKPGDQIDIPANLKYRLLGNMSILQTLTSVLTLYLTYQAAVN